MRTRFSSLRKRDGMTDGMGGVTDCDRLSRRLDYRIGMILVLMTSDRQLPAPPIRERPPSAIYTHSPFFFHLRHHVQRLRKYPPLTAQDFL